VKDALAVASGKHDFLHCWSDLEASKINISAYDKAELIDEVCTEISIYLGLLYHVIEAVKGDDEFAEELSKS
jgi:hypothetical protein